jgi:hypothetical protein
VKEQKIIELAKEIRENLTDEEIILLIDNLQIREIIKEATQIASGQYSIPENTCAACGRPF